MWNPFKKKSAPTEGAAGNPAAQASAKESIEQRIEREIDALPGMIKSKLKDPQVKQRFIDIAKRMEKDGVDFKSIRQMKKWMKEHEAELKAEQLGGPVQKVETLAPAAAARSIKNAAAKTTKFHSRKPRESQPGVFSAVLLEGKGSFLPRGLNEGSRSSGHLFQTKKYLKGRRAAYRLHLLCKRSMYCEIFRPPISSVQRLPNPAHGFRYGK